LEEALGVFGDAYTLREPSGWYNGERDPPCPTLTSILRPKVEVQVHFEAL